jgi:hypothetical protein
MRTCLQAIQTMLPNLIGNPATGITQSVGSPRSHSGAKSSTHCVRSSRNARPRSKKANGSLQEAFNDVVHRAVEVKGASRESA